MGEVVARSGILELKIGERKQVWGKEAALGEVTLPGWDRERAVMCAGCGGQQELLGLLSEGSPPLGATGLDACSRGVWAVG